MRQGVMVLGLVGLLLGSAAARAETPSAPASARESVTVSEARVWLTADSKTMKRMGTQPRVTVEVADGKVGSEACDAIAKATKWGRVLWGMKGKAHEFELRAPIDLKEGKKTIAGKLSVDTGGTTTVSSCELVAYDAAKDDPPVWEADPF
ncbi:MAG: hypothetical protein R3F61_35955 [Myxococcota bacterium]